MHIKVSVSIFCCRITSQHKQSSFKRREVTSHSVCASDTLDRAAQQCSLLRHSQSWNPVLAELGSYRETLGRNPLLSSSRPLAELNHRCGKTEIPVTLARGPSSPNQQPWIKFFSCFDSLTSLSCLPEKGLSFQGLPQLICGPFG